MGQNSDKNRGAAWSDPGGFLYAIKIANAEINKKFIENSQYHTQRGKMEKTTTQGVGKIFYLPHTAWRKHKSV